MTSPRISGIPESLQQQLPVDWVLHVGGLHRSQEQVGGPGSVPRQVGGHQVIQMGVDGLDAQLVLQGLQATGGPHGDVLQAGVVDGQGGAGGLRVEQLGHLGIP